MGGTRPVSVAREVCRPLGKRPSIDIIVFLRRMCWPNLASRVIPPLKVSTTKDIAMTEKEVLETIGEKTAKALALIRECEVLADKFGVYFDLRISDNIKGYYEDDKGWVASQRC
jgi:hypothetical protein